MDLSQWKVPEEAVHGCGGEVGASPRRKDKLKHSSQWGIIGYFSSVVTLGPFPQASTSVRVTSRFKLETLPFSPFSLPCQKSPVRANLSGPSPVVKSPGFQSQPVLYQAFVKFFLDQRGTKVSRVLGFLRFIPTLLQTPPLVYSSTLVSNTCRPEA